MKISKGEYCQFSLKGRADLLQEFGSLVLERTFGHKVVRVFLLYDFYVEMIYNLQNQEIEKIEPVTSIQLLHLYEQLRPSH